MAWTFRVYLVFRLCSMFGRRFSQDNDDHDDDDDDDDEDNDDDHIYIYVYMFYLCTHLYLQLILCSLSYIHTHTHTHVRTLLDYYAFVHTTCRNQSMCACICMRLCFSI